MVTTTTTNGKDETLLRVKDLKMYFPITQGIIFQRRVGDIKAVDGISKRGSLAVILPPAGS